MTLEGQRRGAITWLREHQAYNQNAMLVCDWAEELSRQAENLKQNYAVAALMNRSKVIAAFFRSAEIAINHECNCPSDKKCSCHEQIAAAIRQEAFK